jgi:predicted DNA-binding transcriptional regulator AlpA
MPAINKTSDAALRTPEAAAYCGSSASTFEKLRLTGGGPAYAKLGRRVVYRIEDLDAWLAANRRRSTSDPGEASRSPAR